MARTKSTEAQILKIALEASCQRARVEIDLLERAQVAACGADARRVLDSERVDLMAALQRASDVVVLDARVKEAQRVRAMWAGL